MNKIPMPVVIVLVVVAILAVIWAARRGTGGSGVPTPTGPPKEAIEQLRKSSMGGVRNGGGVPSGRMGGN